MKVLHFFLYAILSFCIVWGLAIVSGPSLIEFFVRQKYEETVKISGLKVSARLSIYASRVDFYNSELLPRLDVSGYSRSVRIDWGNIFFGGQPFVNLSIGPSKIDNIGAFDTLSFRSDIDELKDFSKLNLEIAAENLLIENAGELAFAKLSAEYDTKKKQVSNIKLKGENITYGAEANLKALTVGGSIDSWYLSEEVSQNSSLLDFRIESLSSDVNAATAESMDLLVTINSGVFDVAAATTNGLIGDMFKFERFETEFELEALPYWNVGESVFNLKNFVVSTDEDFVKDGEISAINGLINWRSGTEFDLNLNGKLGLFEVTTDDQFVANISGSDFELDGKIEDKVISADFLITSDTDPVINAKGRAALELSKFGIDKCLELGCDIVNMDLDYAVGSKNASLSGSSSCPFANCGIKSARHSFETTGTGVFFSEIMAAQIFNPLILAGFYSQMISGEKNGNGHKINF